ncbi:TIGR00282 family metallophosphoesterase [Tepidibacillus marianensis]|uniref:TIGR00282 family metallophosphoesterase n=1 Tax=Tepidibacillus marianensis TaxID=3131995 RepID=UPI0030D3CDE2
MGFFENSFFGDIVGSPGRTAIQENINKIKQKYHPQIIIANGENAAHGRGITDKIVKELISQGIQVITMGNHTWDQKEIYQFIDLYPYLIRPANYPSGTPGRGYIILNFNQYKLAVINLQGRTFMPAIDCPFQTVSRLLEEIKQETSNIIVDFHAEATSEKQAMGWFLDGKVSAVVGTHTHVQTADERLLFNDTAYISDIGMVGPYDGILGMRKEEVLEKFITSLPQRFEVDNSGKWQLNAVVIDIDFNTGKATNIERIQFNQDKTIFMD